VVDFRSPYYVGAGFGLGAYLPEALANGVSPFGAAARRASWYDRRKQSVVPWLTNLGDSTPDEVTARIQRHAKHEPGVGAPIAREDWRRGGVAADR
jgi:hypothetical protein